jgi:NADH-quinone oxidoreductase subunit N
MPTDTATVPPLREWFLLAPEIVLAVWGVVVLLVDVLALRRRSLAERSRTLGLLSLAGVLVALACAILPMLSATLGGLVPESLRVNLLTDDLLIFSGTIAADAATAWLNVVLLVLLALVVALSMGWTFTESWGEFYALALWACVGMMLLIAAEELLTLFLTLETMTICLYLMAALEKGRRRSAEAGLKYFIYGSVSSALFLFGLSLIYGLTGSTRLWAIRAALLDPSATPGLEGNVAGALAVLLVLVGFGFKVAAVPFHQWAPDAYEGAPAPAAGWIASGSKLASFIALVKVLVLGLGPWATDPQRITTPGWVGLIAVISAASMTYGNFAALAQRNLKRMLAYSSIAHAGYLLVGVLAAAVSRDRTEATGALLYYLVTYAFATVGAFAVAAWLARDLGSDEISDLDGLGSRRPFLALCIVVLMLSLIGLPPFAGFFGKLAIFMEALNTGEQGRLSLTWLVLLGLLNSVVSAFYYVRVLRAMYLRPATREAVAEPPSGVVWSVVLGTAVAVVFGLYPTGLLQPMRAAALPLLPANEGVATGANPRFVTEPDPEASRRAMEARRLEMQQKKPGGLSAGGGAPPGGRRGRGGQGAPPGERPAEPPAPEGREDAGR